MVRAVKVSKIKFEKPAKVRAPSKPATPKAMPAMVRTTKPNVKARHVI